MTMKKITVTAASLVLGGGLLLSGCGSDPCADLPRPSNAENAAANQGAEIERETSNSFGGDVECVVDRGRWVQDVD
jgi:hypothetical protein